MKSEENIRQRLNRLLIDYFNKDLKYSEKPKVEQRIRELIWVLDGGIIILNGKLEVNKNIHGKKL